MDVILALWGLSTADVRNHAAESVGLIGSEVTMSSLSIDDRLTYHQ